VTKVIFDPHFQRREKVVQMDRRSASRRKTSLAENWHTYCISRNLLTIELSTWPVTKLLPWRGSFCFNKCKIETKQVAIKESDMATFTIILLILLAAAIMPTNIENRFTRDELADMGIHVDPFSPTKIR
jgi:hypothetical protein